MDDALPHYFALADGRMHYLDRGTGHPVICLHGNPTSSYYFRSLIKSMPANLRIIAPDLMGFGKSDKSPTFSGTPQWHAENLSAFLDHLHLEEPYTFVLHDWGGPIGLSVAATQPERVAGLVLMNTWSFVLPESGDIHPLLEAIRRPGGGEALVLEQNILIEQGIRTGVHQRERLSEEILDAYRAPFITRESRKGMLDLVRAIPKGIDGPVAMMLARADQALNQLQVPVLILWGMRDPVFSPAILREWRQRFPDAVVYEFPNASHFVLEDEPERAAILIKQFLHKTRNPRESRRE